MACDEPTVVYRDIQGFPGYRVGDDGSVWSSKIRPPREPCDGAWSKLRPVPTGRHGRHLSIAFAGPRPRKRRYVHQLVLESFVGPRPSEMQACHNNGDGHDNRLANLRWDTRSANTADAMRHGTVPKGVVHHAATISVETVRAIRADFAAGVRQTELVSRYQTTMSVVHSIVRGRRWVDTV